MNIKYQKETDRFNVLLSIKQQPAGFYSNFIYQAAKITMFLSTKQRCPKYGLKKLHRFASKAPGPLAKKRLCISGYATNG